MDGAASSVLGPCRRDGDVRLVGAEAGNETILVDVHTNRVSIPSVEEAGAGAGALLAMRAGSVKERRAGASQTAGSAVAGQAPGVGGAMSRAQGGIAGRGREGGMSSSRSAVRVGTRGQTASN
jgi:hypothetical protein